MSVIKLVERGLFHQPPTNPSHVKLLWYVIRFALAVIIKFLTATSKYQPVQLEQQLKSAGEGHRRFKEVKLRWILRSPSWATHPGLCVKTEEWPAQIPFPLCYPFEVAAFTSSLVLRPQGQNCCRHIEFKLLFGAGNWKDFLSSYSFFTRW